MFNVQTFNGHHWCSSNSSNKFICFKLCVVFFFSFSSAHFISFIQFYRLKVGLTTICYEIWNGNTPSTRYTESKNALNYSFILNLIFIENVHISRSALHSQFTSVTIWGFIFDTVFTIGFDTTSKINIKHNRFALKLIHLAQEFMNKFSLLLLVVVVFLLLFFWFKTELSFIS